MSELARRPKNPTRWGLIAVLVPVAVVAIWGPPLVMRVFAFEAFVLDGPSMQPAIEHGDRVVVDKAAYGVFIPFTDQAIASWADPEVGEVVIIHSPADEIDIVKRVIGVAGDTIEIREDQVLRNDVSIRRGVEAPCADRSADCVEVSEQVGDRTWTTRRAAFSLPDQMAPQTVPPGHVFVLGDHRDRSNDSRNPRVGMIPLSRLKGRVFALYWQAGAPTFVGVQ